MMNCPHSIYFFRGKIEDFGLLDEYKGRKNGYELTRSPNPLLNIHDNGDYYQSTSPFTTNNLYVTPFVKVNTWDYVRVVSVKEGDHVVAKFDVMGDSFANTFRDWHIVPLGRPIVNPPEHKTHFIEIPGTSGIVDISNSLTKYPVFNNRVGSWTFAILSDNISTPDAYEKILNFLQGSDVKFILEDDPLYYYQGRVYVESLNPKSDGTASEITLGYDVDPYKRSITLSSDSWDWDKFKFQTDVIEPSPFRDIRVPADGNEHTLDVSDKVGILPVVPTFSVTLPLCGTLNIKLYNSDLGINWKTYTLSSTNNIKTFTKIFPDLVMCEFTKESVIKIKMQYIPKDTPTGVADKDNARVNITFRSGRL